jgi:hypothetical protein
MARSRSHRFVVGLTSCTPGRTPGLRAAKPPRLSGNAWGSRRRLGARLVLRTRDRLGAPARALALAAGAASKLHPSTSPSTAQWGDEAAKRALKRLEVTQRHATSRATGRNAFCRVLSVTAPFCSICLRPSGISTMTSRARHTESSPAMLPSGWTPPPNHHFFLRFSSGKLKSIAANRPGLPRLVPLLPFPGGSTTELRRVVLTASLAAPGRRHSASPPIEAASTPRDG